LIGFFFVISIKKLCIINRLHAKKSEKITQLVPFYVFMGQIKEIWDKMHHIQDLINFLPQEQKAASRYLMELENIGILESQKVGRETLYINKDLIEILKQ